MTYRVKVLSEAKASAGDVLVCAPAGEPSRFTDDVQASCAECGAAIRHRPHAPATLKKLCVPCFLPILRKHPDALIGTTKRMGLELRDAGFDVDFGSH